MTNINLIHRSLSTLPHSHNRGLSEHEASKRLKAFGPNEIRQELQRPLGKLLISQFTNPLVLILILACILSLLLGEKIEALAIASILILNALIGFLQEYRAETAVAALKNLTAPKARVLRDGKQALLSAKDVVVGDILLLEAGDLIAADGRLLEASRFLVNEAILTGESMPVEKSVSSSSEELVFMGTTVHSGTAAVEVLGTGMKTELGKIAHLITTAETSATPIQQQLTKLGRTLLLVCLAIVLIISVIGFLNGMPFLEIVVYALSLAVAAVPEGMPAIVTVALALGLQRLATRNAWVRRLPAVETLGSVSVICTDKTGTLTTGEMRVRELWGKDHNELMRAASSCVDAELTSDGKSHIGDPTEVAILLEAKSRGIEKAKIEELFPRIFTEPFDSEKKWMAIFRKDGCLYAKGAVESLLTRCSINDDTSATVKKANEDMASRGLRVLAVAVGKDQEVNNLQFLGLIGIADPPRTEVIEAIREARQAGIRLVMITGDHPTTAAAIARELGLVLDDEALAERVHARATPEDKLKLVREWKSKGAIVAMTGDGVNDAPALREAHIGIAMGKTGTDVTRQAADLILADDNFATIVTAIREGRGIYQNIRKAIVYLLTGNTGELSIILGASLLGLPLPFLAAHLLWINLVTDSLPALALIGDPIMEDTMKRAPRSSSENLLGRAEWITILWVGLLEAAVGLGFYYWLLRTEGEVTARNATFTMTVFSQLFRALGARSRTKIYTEVGTLSNLWLIGVIFGTGLLQLSLHYFPLGQKIFGLSPLSIHEWMVILPLSLIPISAIEIRKIILRHSHN
jgi:P-type Ca2+ transporter type 2C